MRRQVSVALAVVAGLALASADGGVVRAADSSANQQGGRQLDPDLPGVGPKDEDFVTTARATLRPTVEMSRLGAEKASDQEVVTLSQKMAERYAELAEELDEAAGAAEVTGGAGEAPHIDNRLDRLEAASSEFDLTYLTEQRGAHKKLISIYTMETRAGEKEALRTHAERGRQLFTENAEAIERLETRLREERTSPTR